MINIWQKYTKSTMDDKRIPYTLEKDVFEPRKFIRKSTIELI